MTVCYTRLPFPVPQGLLERPVITARAMDAEVDLARYPIAYDLEGAPVRCEGVAAIRWPETAPVGGLYPAEPGEHVITATVDTGVDGFVALSAATLTVIEADCAPADCAPCGLDCGEGEQSYGQVQIVIQDAPSGSYIYYILGGLGATSATISTADLDFFLYYDDIFVFAIDTEGHFISEAITDISIDYSGSMTWQVQGYSDTVYVDDPNPPYYIAIPVAGVLEPGCTVCGHTGVLTVRASATINGVVRALTPFTVTVASVPLF